jgi:hypothetical protein
MLCQSSPTTQILWWALGQQLGDLVLGVVGVLVLVDHDVLELLLVFGQDVGVIAEHHGRCGR